MNMVHICGNIGAEPEFSEFQSGKSKVTFSVALNQYGTDGKQIDTIWIPCQAWDYVCDRFLKCQQRYRLSGRRIILSGPLTQSKWTDPDNGRQHVKLMVKVQSFELLASTQQDSSSNPRPEVEGSAAVAAKILNGKPVPLAERKRTSSKRSK